MCKSCILITDIIRCCLFYLMIAATANFNLKHFQIQEPNETYNEN